MTEDIEALARSWRPALLGYVGHGREDALLLALDLGREAVARGIGLIDVVQVHQDMVAELLRDEDPAAVSGLLQAADAFLREALAPYAMSHPGYPPRRGPGSGAGPS